MREGSATRRVSGSSGWRRLLACAGSAGSTLRVYSERREVAMGRGQDRGGVRRCPKQNNRKYPKQSSKAPEAIRRQSAGNPQAIRRQPAGNPQATRRQPAGNPQTTQSEGNLKAIRRQSEASEGNLKAIRRQCSPRCRSVRRRRRCLGGSASRARRRRGDGGGKRRARAPRAASA